VIHVEACAEPIAGPSSNATAKLTPEVESDLLFIAWRRKAVRRIPTVTLGSRFELEQPRVELRAGFGSDHAVAPLQALLETAAVLQDEEDRNKTVLILVAVANTATPQRWCMNQEREDGGKESHLVHR